MKKLFVFLAIAAIGVLFTAEVKAQWGTSGNNIYNTNIGNIGMGAGASWTPTEKLHIKTAAVSGILLETDAASGATGYFRIKNTTGGQTFNLVLRKTGTQYEMLQSVYDPAVPKWCEFIYFNVSTHKYEVRGGIVDTEFKNTGMVVFSNPGGVVIGAATVPAGSKFAVNGKILCTEVEVTATGWADHVFKSGYDLLPLSAVESFITTNKHLPGVPSEQEVLKNGVKLGEMDAILLKKIEELTLYMIELKKENEQLKTKIENLR